MSTTVNGVRFSDQLAALLEHAIAHGWRVEPDTRGAGKAKANAAVLYAPDKDVPPLTLNERSARFNKAHYENVRRELYAAGLPPMPTDAASNGRTAPKVVVAASEQEAIAGMPPGYRAVPLGAGLGLADDGSLEAIVAEGRGPQLIATLTEGLAQQIGLAEAEAELLAVVNEVLASWLVRFGVGRSGAIHAKAEEVRQSLAAEYDGQIAAAVKLAEEAEHRATTAERRADKAEARGSETGRLLTAAVARADAAEARARELEAAIAPLRAILGQPAS